MNLRNYIYSHCVNPVRVKIWDSYSQQFIYRELPCGKCLHCQNTHINEWCTRLFAQRKYSKYCYYVSLDYAPFDEASPVSMQLAKETAACYHDINKYKSYGLHPLVLCKNHLQDFFKRLRKNTNIKLQYFSCGEYGTHANGTGFGRPHFHNIIFSDFPISENEFVKAWTIDGYKIGRVDFKDMDHLFVDSSTTTADEQLKIFRYVCKYLQKSDFDFEKLATINFHRAYFKSLEQTIINQGTLFPEFVPIEDKQQIAIDWKEYCRIYSPFIVCSRRPSIGSAYLADNLERFKKQDFRLFGLPMEGLAFPRYFQRKSQESLYSIQCLGSKSEKPSSSSRMGYVLQVLSELYNARLDVANWNESSEKCWHISRKTEDERTFRCISWKGCRVPIKCNTLSFYDMANKFLYQFNGYNYNVWAKVHKGVFTKINEIDICDILREFGPDWCKFHKSWITKFHDSRVIHERELDDLVHALYKPTDNKSSYDLFYEHVYSLYRDELATRYKTKLLMQNSKTTL